jgi:hypothetical protein
MIKNYPNTSSIEWAITTFHTHTHTHTHARTRRGGRAVVRPGLRAARDGAGGRGLVGGGAGRPERRLPRQLRGGMRCASRDVLHRPPLLRSEGGG